MPKPFVSASEAREHSSACDCREHTCCFKARFERETFRLPTCCKYLSDLITSYQPCEPGPVPEELRDGQQEVRTAKPRIGRQPPLAERPLPPGRDPWGFAVGKSTVQGCAGSARTPAANSSLKTGSYSSCTAQTRAAARPVFITGRGGKQRQNDKCSILSPHEQNGICIP